MKKITISALLVLALLALTAAYFQPRVQSQSALPTIELISVGTDGIAGNGPSGAGFLSSGFPPRNRISADGRYVVFESEAFNLVCSDTNSSQDIFVRDRKMGATILVSLAENGAQANNNSFDPAMSADGRYVAFESAATNLVSGDTNGTNDIFLRDLQTGTTTLVSVSSTGEQANSVSHSAAISADGRYVAYFSNGSNLVTNDTNNNFDVFVHDRRTGTTERVSVTTSGAQGTCCSSLEPSISADGRYVAFLSQNRLDPSFNSNWQEVFVRDRQAGTTMLVSLTANGGLSNTGVRVASISADGRHVAFQSNSDNIVTPDQNGFQHDIFLRDIVAGTTTLVSVASDGTQGNRDSFMPSISGNGRYVTFHSWSNNLVPGDTNTGVAYDVFLRDTLLNTTTRLSVSPSGAEANGNSTFSFASDDGSLTYFQSTASNLVIIDHPNGYLDVFLYGPPYPGAGAPGFQFNSSSYSLAESGGRATITITRTGNACGPATVDYATADGTATSGPDYASASGTLTFLASETSKTFSVDVVNDALDEPDETVNLFLSNPTGGLTLGSTSVATLTILDDDAPVNSPPIATNDSATTDEDTTVTINVLANDTDADGDVLTISNVAQGAHGSVSLNAHATVTYTPQANFNGSDSFTYQTKDQSNGESNVATVTVVVNAVNDPPVANGQSVSTDEDTASAVTLAATDVDGDALTYSIVIPPAHGSLSGTAPNLTYTPGPNYNGPDSYTFKANDGSLDSNVAAVNITVSPVNDAPNAVDDAGTTAEETPLTISVLANDTDADGDALSVSSVTAPANGAAVINADQSVKYTPNTNFNGTDSFTCTVSDGQGGTDAATVNITITPVNDAPDANADAATSAEDTAADINVLANDTDVEGDALSVQSVTQAANGSVSINIDGTVKYTPAADFNGSDTFTYTVSDGNGGTDTATVSVIVSAVNDAPDAVDDLSSTTAEDTPVTISVLENDTDVEGDALAFQSVTQPVNGTAVINADGTVRYTPNTNFNGTDSFTYTVSDGQGGADTATVNLKIIAVNDAPDAVDDAAATDEDLAVVIAVLANDTDADGDTLTISSVTQGVNGSAVDNGDGSITYKPDSDFFGSDAFSYTIGDGSGGTDTATVRITVAPVNDAPIAKPDIYSGTTSSILVVAAPGVLKNDVDVEGSRIVAELVSSPGIGTLDFNPDGSFTYTPGHEKATTDKFSYRASDGVAVSPEMGVEIVITGDKKVKVVDTTTTIPGGVGSFTAFPVAPSSAIGGVAFLGLGANGQQGLYAKVAIPSPPPIRLADLSTAIPGGVGSFTAFSDPGFAFLPTDATHKVFFIGTGPSGQQGVYVASAGDAGQGGDPPPIRLADGNTAIPAGDGTFTALRNPVVAVGGGEPPPIHAAFVGEGTGSQQGVYLASASGDPPPIRLADISTTIPNGQGTFTAFRDPALTVGSGEPPPIHVAFIGSGTGNQEGVYLAPHSAVAVGDPPPIRVADVTTTIPDGNGSFTGFSQPAIVEVLVGEPPPIRVAFIGTGSGNQQGVYLVSAAGNPPPIRVADRTTQIPLGQGTFTAFHTVSASRGHVAFLGSGSGGQKGIYLASTLTKIVDLSDTIDGKTLVDLRFSRSGLSGNQLAFGAVFADGSEGIFVVTVDFPDVNDAPIANADSYGTDANVPLTVAAPGVLGNDDDVENDALTASVVTAPANGSVVLNADGSFTYTPNANFPGTDSFTYKATDANGAESNVASVTITVRQVICCSVDVQVNPASARRGQTVSITASVRNVSSASQNVTVAFELTTPYSMRLGSFPMTLAANTNRSKTVSFRVPSNAKLGTYSLKLTTTTLSDTIVNTTTFTVVP